MPRCGHMTYTRNYYTARSDRTSFSINIFNAFAATSRCTVRTRLRYRVTMSCLSLRRRHLCRYRRRGDSWFGPTRSVRFSMFGNKISVYLSKPPNYRFDGMYYKSERARPPVWVARSRHPPETNDLRTVSLRYLVELVRGTWGIII